MGREGVTNLATHRRKKVRQARDSRKAAGRKERQARFDFFMGPYVVSEDFTVDYARHWPAIEKTTEE